jgi:phosphatidylserine decarboxylase
MVFDPERRSGAIAHIVSLARDTVPPMHPAGRPFVLGGLIAMLLLRQFSKRAGLLAALGTAWCAWFFREPRRVTPRRPGIVVAAADGTISQIARAVPPAELGIGTQPLLRISTFLSVFDVHVQRVPVTGVVNAVAYRPGKFLSADLDKASEDNERNSMVLRTAEGSDVVVVQIAGLIARRIVCSVRKGAEVEVGQTYGLIRFGSRVDLYLPPGSHVLVEQGQRAIGGETILAELPSVSAMAEATPKHPPRAPTHRTGD